jgi:histidinol dehydrogenase
MPIIEIIDWRTLDEAGRAAALRRPALIDRADLAARVAEIIATVRERGDAALVDYARRFDGVAPAALRVPPEAFERARAELAPEALAAMAAAVANIRAFHEAQRVPDLELEPTAGVRLGRLTRPLDAVGLYVPAGSAPLPSTVMMLAVPARVAGCPRAVIVTPPRADGAADASVLAAAGICGIEEVYVAGGAQAVAALAYGTETVPSVDKIYGPGNAWVTEAKLQVARDPEGAACDLPAGPSEVLVIADAGARPAWVAADLLSQAEHGADSQALLVTTCETLARRVAEALEAQLETLSRAEIARAALAHGRILVVEDLAGAIAVSNAYAPEHLIIQTADAEACLADITAAGSVFVGHYTPESLGDYCSGTNHVLPTYGFARTFSGLGIEDFQRRITVQAASPQGLRNIGPVAATLAELEGLDGHARAVTLRLADLADQEVA